MKASPNLTALVLTYNEEENIARTLNSIAWVEKIVVLDSGGPERILAHPVNRGVQTRENDIAFDLGIVRGM